MDYMLRDNSELVPLTRCMYCLGGHELKDCPEKHDCFLLTYNDEQFLDSIGVFYPRVTAEGFVVDPNEPPYKPGR